MIKNYLKIAWRNLVKNKTFSFLNIVGLAVGMTVAMLIGLWVWDELSFNTSFKNYNRIAIVMQTTTNANGMQTLPYTPYPLGEALRKEHGSNFKEAVVASGTWQHTLKAGQKQLEQRGVFMESGAGRLLGLEMISGVQSGLEDPNSVMLSQSVAEALFNTQNVQGKMLMLDKDMAVKVTGVYKDLPLNSALADLQFIAPWSLLYNHDNYAKNVEEPWRSNSFFTYVQLAENADIDHVSSAIKNVRLNHVNSKLAKQKPQLLLHPMTKWHLYDEFKNGVNTGGAIQYVWLFGIIGVFVLLLACINFMNLSTARSIKRAKEVGIRKTVGSMRNQLITQFFCESFLYVVFAFVISLVLVQLSLPAFNEVAGKQMQILWLNPLFWLSVLAFCFITGIIAGLYPALYLSSFKPIKVLKGSFYAGRLAGLPRKVLVVLQFTVSIVMIIGTIVVFRQMQFAMNRPLGYDRNGLVAVNMPSPELHKHFEVIKSTLKNEGAIVNMTESFSTPANINSTSTGFDWKGKDPQQAVEFPTTGVGFDYGKTVGWEIKAGRDFSKDFATDSTGIILNEAAAKFIGFKSPVGETINWDGHMFTVIGVVKDVVLESPYAQVRPSVYYFIDETPTTLIVRLNPKIPVKDAIKKIEATYRKYSGEQPFNYMFSDEEYAAKFGNEQRIGRLAGFFAILAIFISCLGLFGMASFMAEQRSKEIGVRKVLGASVSGLWTLLSGDFVKLVLISFIIAAPIGWYLMNNWLQGYTYRSGISVWIFGAAGLGAVVITLLTVSYQAVKAALANPVRSLRSE